MKQRIISAIIALIIVVPLIILGGIPYYLEQFDSKKSIADNIKYNIQKAINDKMNSDRILSQYKKDIAKV